LDIPNFARRQNRKRSCILFLTEVVIKYTTYR